MANRWAVATGNWSSLSTWDGGASLPGAGDTVCANTYTVTIDQDVTVGTITTAAAGSGAAGGSFVLNTGRVVTANIQAGSTDCISFASGTSTIVGTITGSATTNTTASVSVTGGTLNITGDVYGGAASSNRYGVKILSGSPTVNITGNVGRNSSAMASLALLITTTGNATVNVTGNLLGGTGDCAIYVNGIAAVGHVISVSGNVTAGTGSSAYGILLQAATVCTITVGGNVTGASSSGSSVHGILCNSASSNVNITVSGNVCATNYGGGINQTSSLGLIKILGNADASGSTSVAHRAVETSSSTTIWVVGNAIQGSLAAAVGVAAGFNTSVTRIDGNIIGNSVGQGIRIWGILYVNSYTDNTCVFPNSIAGSVSAAGTSVTLYGAAAGGSGQASQADVRHGTVYGPSSELTGTCYVPGAASVLYGVNVDATVGTAVVTAASIAAAVWDAARSGHTTAGSYGATSEWAGSLPSEAPANWIKSTSINAGALNGKGDWAAVGSAMTLADAAITAAKFDETTAYPIVSADSGSTRIARTGADSDTLETLSDQIDGVSGGTGTGANSVTITINDGTSPLENANVRVTQGAETRLDTTNSSGVVNFSLDDATWTVRVTKPGYTLSAQTLIVNGTKTVTYSMTLVSVTAPSDPSLSRLVATCYGTDGQPEEGVKVHFQMTSGTGDAGIVHDSGVKTITSNASGELKVDSEWPEFVIGATYRARRGNVGEWVEKTIPDADSFTWGEILGSP